MKLAASLLACWVLGTAGSFAQVRVELVSEATNFRATESTRLGQFLPNESLIIGVQIINRSGQTLTLGKDSDWLSFSIESTDNQVVRLIDDVPVKGEFTLESSLMGTKRVDLAPYYELTRPGRYRIVATVRIPQWGEELRSFPKYFDIVSGSAIWQQEIGLPNPAGVNGAPEVRKFSLVQARLLDQLKLYVRVTDVYESKVYAVYSLGSMLSFSKPEVQVDRHSDVHVIFQYGARTFIYYELNPDGKVLTRQTHDYTNKSSRPHLDISKDGEITVAGGIRRPMPTDIPPPGLDEAKSAPDVSPRP